MVVEHVFINFSMSLTRIAPHWLALLDRAVGAVAAVAVSVVVVVVVVAAAAASGVVVVVAAAAAAGSESLQAAAGHVGCCAQ